MMKLHILAAKKNINKELGIMGIPLSAVITRAIEILTHKANMDMPEDEEQLHRCKL